MRQQPQKRNCAKWEKSYSTFLTVTYVTGVLCAGGGGKPSSLTFWPSAGAPRTYIPLLLMAAASDSDDSSTDPWLSFTVFNHSKC